MSAFFEDIFNKQQCRFHKGYNTQQCLLQMLEKWKRSVDDALLTGLFKAFDYLDHELLIAKVNAYGQCLFFPPNIAEASGCVTRVNKSICSV